MSPRVRAVAGFKRFTDPQLVTTGRGVVKEMKDNPNFPNPPEELKTSGSRRDSRNGAQEEQASAMRGYLKWSWRQWVRTTLRAIGRMPGCSPIHARSPSATWFPEQLQTS